MNTTVNALKTLYVAMGGSMNDTYEDIAGGVAVSNYVLIPDMIDAIANKVSAGGVGSALPAVTAADNGKILKVADGAWSVGEDLAVVTDENN